MVVIITDLILEKKFKKKKQFFLTFASVDGGVGASAAAVVDIGPLILVVEPNALLVEFSGICVEFKLFELLK